MSVKADINMKTILKTAAEIADKQGFEAVTLASLAKKLAIKSPSLYNHINGMNGLRKNLSIYGHEKLYDSLVQAAIGRSGDEAINKLSETYLTFVRKHNGLYDAMFFYTDPNDKDLQIAGKKIVDLVLTILEVYNLKKEYEIHVVRGLRSLLHGFASLEQKGGFGIPLNPDESLKIMINVFLTGIHSLQNSEKQDS